MEVVRHRDRHDVDGRRIFEQRAPGMQGIVSVFGGASAWRNVDAEQRVVWCRSQISVSVTFVDYVRQAQLIGESCGGKVNVGKQNQLFENAMRRVGQDNGGFMIVNGETMAADNSVLFSPPHVA
jgi:hypothetical protein